MKAMFEMKATGAGDRMKVLTFMVLSAVLAMAWVFVEVFAGGELGWVDKNTNNDKIAPVNRSLYKRNMPGV